MSANAHQRSPTVNVVRLHSSEELPGPSLSTERTSELRDVNNGSASEANIGAGWCELRDYTVNL